jgi:hypothetical protein
VRHITEGDGGRSSSLLHGDTDGPFVSEQELDMNGEQSEISEPELTAEEMDDVSGAYRNNQTEA